MVKTVQVFGIGRYEAPVEAAVSFPGDNLQKITACDIGGKKRRSIIHAA